MYFFFYFQVSNLQFPAMEGIAKNIIKEKQNFERLEVSKERLLEMFKVRLIFIFVSYFNFFFF